MGHQSGSALHVPARRKAYSYKPLHTGNTIRLLRLEPGQGSEPLKGELYRTKLVDARGASPQYEALSYVWGEGTFSQEIHTPGGIISLTPSLAMALRRVRTRHPDRAQQIWADAICINQQNRMERGHQVKLMGQIYSAAQRVLVWLGPDPRLEAKRIFGLSADPKQTSTLEGVRDLREALKILVRCKWFSRLWVVQECLLARSKLCMWGNEEIDFDYLRFHDVFTLDDGLPWFALKATGRTSLELTVFNLLARTRGLKCTDERDRIYAILGLPYDKQLHSDLVIHLRSIEPDYSRSIGHTVLEHARAFVRCSRTCLLLAQVCHGASLGTRKRDRPSWIPDLSNMIGEDYSPLEVHSTGLQAFVKPPMQFWDRMIGVDTLSMTGWNITDEVCVLGPVMDPEAAGSGLEDIATFWRDHVHPNDRDRGDLPVGLQDQLFLQVLSCSTWDQNLSVDWKALHAALFSTLRSLKTTVMSDRVTTMLQSLEASATSRKGYLKIRRWRKPHCFWKQRRLVKTRIGIVGLAPLAAESGDTVVFFPHFDQPLVLRKQHHYYHFVGVVFMPTIPHWFFTGKGYRTFELR
jgi:hypothetical protein